MMESIWLRFCLFFQPSLSICWWRQVGRQMGLLSWRSQGRSHYLLDKGWMWDLHMSKILPVFPVSLFWQEELNHVKQLCFQLGRDPTGSSISCLEIAVAGGCLMLPLGHSWRGKGIHTAQWSNCQSRDILGGFLAGRSPAGSGRLGVMSHHGEGDSHSALRGQTPRGCFAGGSHTWFGASPKCTAKPCASITYRKKDALGLLWASVVRWCEWYSYKRGMSFKDGQPCLA